MTAQARVSAPTEQLEITIGWPPVELSPNSRSHYMVKHRAGKKAEEEAMWATRIVKPLSWNHDGSKLRLTFIAHPPDKRSRDDDNFAARLKKSRDGIAKALGVDDRVFEQQQIIFAEPVKTPCVVVLIGAA